MQVWHPGDCRVRLNHEGLIGHRKARFFIAISSLLPPFAQFVQLRVFFLRFSKHGVCVKAGHGVDDAMQRRKEEMTDLDPAT